MGYTLREACTQLGIAPNTARRWIKQGKLKAELKPGVYGDEYEIDDAEIERVKSGYSQTTTIVRTPEQNSTVEVPTSWLLEQLEDRITTVVRDTVRAQVEAEVSAGLEKLQRENEALRSLIENRLEERDRQLTEAMKNLLEAAKERHDQQHQSKWWPFGRRK